MRLRVRRDRQGRVLYRRHPNGWTIWRRYVEEDRRGWTQRGGGGFFGVGPKVYWEVKRTYQRSSHARTFDLLKQARTWCDEHGAPPEGESDEVSAA